MSLNGEYRKGKLTPYFESVFISESTMIKKTKTPFLRRTLRKLGHISFLRFGIRDRIIRFFHSPDLAVDETFTVEFFGKKYSGRYNTFIDWSVFYYGAYSIQELYLIRDLIRFMTSPRFLDVGANIGHHTLFASALCDEVVALEPFPEVYCKIEEKIRENQLTNVRLFKYGFGETNGVVEYFPPNTTNTGTGSFVQAEKSGAGIQLQIVRADDFIVQEKLLPFSFVKIDTEGYEPSVLKGMKGMLQTQRPIVFFEWTQGYQGSFTSEAREELFPSSYGFYQFHEPSNLFVFQRSVYRLTPVDGHWMDGMILAIPEEYSNMSSFREYLHKRLK